MDAMLGTYVSLLLLLAHVGHVGDRRFEAPPSLDKSALHLRVEHQCSMQIVALSEPCFSWRKGALLTAQRVAPKRVELALAVLRDELGLYPKSFFRNAKVRRIVLVERLLDGGFWSAERVGGVAWYQRTCIVLDVDRLESDPGQRQFRAAIHHELFHCVDHALGTIRRDSEWVSLNDPLFRYAHAGRPGRAAAAVVKSAPPPGVISAYAQTSAAEDKADLYSYLVVVPSYVEERSQSDAIVCRKIACLKARLQAFCPELDAGFWELVKRLEPPSIRD
jgi:fido (protein-threonine AMPylation protein)